MVEEKKNQSYPNFVMLTENLYKLFIQYINGGRLRAPPESDLVDMKTTFQKGAKTNRRALQSKFKSWAKRMMVDQSKLKLSFSGKEIIPQEKCRDVVMHLHSEGHKSIDIVVSKIQERYTWTKKNFGMDRDMVLKLILENCPSQECRQQVEREMSKRNCCENFIKSVIVASEAHLKQFPENKNRLTSATLNNSFFVNSSPIYAWPMVLPAFPNNALNDKYLFPYQPSDGHMTIQRQPNTYMGKERHYYSSGAFKRKIQDYAEHSLEIPNKYYRIAPKSKADESKADLKQYVPPPKVLRPCRKPKNINDFRNLMKFAEEESESYPPILCLPKTKFLGSLELVPKRICSKKTLMTFDQEKKRKKKFEKMKLMCIMRRKNLRDRNKLYKIKMKSQQEKRAYLGATTPRKTFLPQSEESFIENSINSNWEQENGGSPGKDCDQGVTTYGKGKITCEGEKEIEVINLTSSEEESYDNHKNNGPDAKKKQEFTIISKFDYGSSNEKENLQCFRNSSMLELKRKEAILNQYFRTGINGFKRSEKPAELVFGDFVKEAHKLERNDSRVSSNNMPLKEKSPHSSSIRRYLIPANIKGEIAVIPPSRLYPVRQLKPFPGFNPTKNGSKYFPQVKKEFPVTDIMPKVLDKKSDTGEGSLNLHVMPLLPKDTSTLLMEKTPTGVFTMIPYTVSNMPEVITSQDSVSAKIRGISQKKLTPVKCNQTSSSGKHQWKTFSSTKECSVPNHLQELNLNKKSLDEGMSKLTTFINKMKTDMVQVLFQSNIDRSAQRMEAQLNAGIALVKNIRKRLYQVEKLERLCRIVELADQQEP